MAHINSLLLALKQEVDRISEEQASDTSKEELAAVFLEAISKTLREIKMGADSDDFQELTIINFIILADAAGFTSDFILNFVTELKKGTGDASMGQAAEAFRLKTEKIE